MSRMPDAVTFAGGPAVTIAPGVAMPLLGLGVWQSRPGRECERAVAWALEAGYRHVDTAEGYRNEESVGRALRSAAIAREDLFVTTKWSPRRGDPRAAIEASLERLGLDRVDLYLVHWPAPGSERAWPAMERLLADGLARAIGVSNWRADALARLVADAAVPPAVNQIDWSPERYDPAVLAAHRDLGVVLEGYSPLGRGRLVHDPVVGGVAAEVGRTPAQVLIRWSLERGTPAIPKSVTRERILGNLDVLGWSLDAGHLARLDALAG